VSALDTKAVETVKTDSATVGIDQLRAAAPKEQPKNRPPRPSEFKWRKRPDAP
jgi:hypothetical protein